MYGKRDKMYVYACVCMHVRDSIKKEKERASEGVEGEKGRGRERRE